MADNKINYDYIAGKLKTETGKHFDSMRAFLDTAGTETGGQRYDARHTPA